jgi:hypothetical protein
MFVFFCGKKEYDVSNKEEREYLVEFKGIFINKCIKSVAKREF